MVVALFVGMLAMLIATATLPSAAGAQTASRVIIPDVTGEIRGGGTVDGRIVSPRIVYREATDAFRITGTLVGAVTQDGTTERARREDLNTRLTIQQGSQQECTILTLDIGPIHLDLLGLVVDISAIEIDVTAVPGAGNRLGNRLCAVAGLLDDLNGFSMRANSHL
jgi:hypothetical protein